MGATYSVRASLHYMDKESAVKGLTEFVKNPCRKLLDDSRKIDFRTEELGIKFDGTSEDIIHALLPPDQSLEYEKVTEFYEKWKSDFDGRYGWYEVMVKGFGTMAPFLYGDSDIEIWIDGSMVRLSVEKGKIHIVEAA